jgi:hypothetical protein
MTAGSVFAFWFEVVAGRIIMIFTPVAFDCGMSTLWAMGARGGATKLTLCVCLFPIGSPGSSFTCGERKTF